MLTQVQKVYNQMIDIDNRGIFESDDQVGILWDNISIIIEKLEGFIDRQ